MTNEALADEIERQTMNPKNLSAAEKERDRLRRVAEHLEHCQARAMEYANDPIYGPRYLAMMRDAVVANLSSITAALRVNAAPQSGRDHDFAHILQLCSDTDEADPKKLLQEIAAIANKHPWPIPASSLAAGHAEGDSVVVPREPAAWKFRMDGIDQVILDEDADIHIRRHGVPLYLAAAPKGDKHG